MNFRTVFGTLLTALCVISAVAKAGETTTSTATAAARFEAVKKLAGDWVERGKDGTPTDKLVSSIRVTAGGTVVEETLFPGTDHEMVTMYHRDGDDLVLTHYCTLGNQPRMRAEPGGAADRIAFAFVGATNLKSDDDHHMRRATLNLADPDRYRSEWVPCKEGGPCGKVAFDLVRRPRK